jgi:hypothetical protein
MGMFDGTLFVPRVLVKRLEMIAEEVNHYGRENLDASALATQILEEFCRVRLHEANQVIARKMQGVEEPRPKPRHEYNLDIAPPRRTFMFHDSQANVHQRVPLPEPPREHYPQYPQTYAQHYPYPMNQPIPLQYRPPQAYYAPYDEE